MNVLHLFEVDAKDVLSSRDRLPEPLSSRASHATRNFLFEECSQQSHPDSARRSRETAVPRLDGKYRCLGI